MQNQIVTSNIHSNIKTLTIEFDDCGESWVIPSSKISALYVEDIIKNPVPFTGEEANNSTANQASGIYANTVSLILEPEAVKIKSDLLNPNSSTLLKQLSLPEEDESHTIVSLTINDGEEDQKGIGFPLQLWGFSTNAIQQVIKASNHYIIRISTNPLSEEEIETIKRQY